MSNEPSHNEDHPELRKLLKALPKKTASADFEMRLQRRLNEGKSSTQSETFFGKLFDSFRVPAFAYSLMTLLVVGTISYYAFFRDTGSPRLPEREIPVLNDRAPEQPSADKVIPQEATTTNQTVDERAKDAVKGKSQVSTEQLPEQASKPEKELLQFRSVPQKSEQANVEMKENLIDEAPRQEVSAPAQEMSAPVQDEVRQEEQISLPEKKSDGNVQSIVPQSENVTAPLLNKILPQMKSAGQLNAFVERDSTTIRDSIKADSLMKLQKLKLLRQNQRIRKPNN